MLIASMRLAARTRPAHHGAILSACKLSTNERFSKPTGDAICARKHQDLLIYLREGFIGIPTSVGNI